MTMNKKALILDLPDPDRRSRDIIIPAIPAMAGLPKSGRHRSRSVEIQTAGGRAPVAAKIDQATDGSHLPAGEAYLTLLRLWSSALGGSGLRGGRVERRHLAEISRLVITCHSGAPGSTTSDDRPGLVLDHRGKLDPRPRALLRPWPGERLIRMPAALLDACSWSPGGRWSPVVGHLLVFLWGRCCRARRRSRIPSGQILSLILPPEPSSDPSAEGRRAESGLAKLRDALARLQAITEGQIPARWLSRPLRTRRRGRPAAEWWLEVDPGFRVGTQIVIDGDTNCPLLIT